MIVSVVSDEMRVFFFVICGNWEGEAENLIEKRKTFERERERGSNCFLFEYSMFLYMYLCDKTVSGFALLESGCVTRKNEVNIMVKNAVDVVFGGLGYWMYGYGLSFGR